MNQLTDVSYNNVAGVATTASVSIRYKDSSPGKGQVDMVTDGAGTESYGYDSLGRLQSCTRMIDGISYPKQYEYNAAGQMTSMTYPSGKKVNVGRDDRGRLAALQRVDVSGAPAYLSGITYRADGLVSGQTLGDGTTESFGYSDDRLQLTSQKVMKGGSTLLDLSYGYGALAGQMGNGSAAGNSGQLVSVTGTINGRNRNQTFTYDNVGRLVTATGLSGQPTEGTPWARRHDYDRYGNRTAVWDAVSGGNPLQNIEIGQANGMTTNRIANVNGTAFEYDASGNVTREGARTYTYDAANRLVSVSEPGGESYGYDAMNHRVKKVVGGVVTHYIWEGDSKVIAEYERGGGNTQATGTRYYHQDRLSTRIITDGAGNVKGTTDHLPFGEEIGFTGEPEKHKFTSYERDGALDYAVNRHYDPHLGRFNQADPLRMGAASLLAPQSLNLYSYVRNNPVNSVDPLGLLPGLTCMIDGVPVNCSTAFNFVNHGFGTVSGGAGVYGDGSVVVLDQYGEGEDGPEWLGHRVFSEQLQDFPYFVDLPPDKEHALNDALGAVQNALYNPSESCLNNVINPLAEKLGFGVADFYNYLNQGAKFYNGTATLAAVAGNVTSTAAANAQYGPYASVASVFNQTQTDRSTGATLRTDALTSITTPTFTAYFRPSAIDSSGTSAGLARNAGLLFHEALHGFGGTLGGTSYFDSDLKSAFGLTGPGSNSISEHISRNCFQ